MLLKVMLVGYLWWKECVTWKVETVTVVVGSRLFCHFIKRKKLYKVTPIIRRLLFLFRANYVHFNNRFL